MKIISIGEVLWDVIGEAEHAGGAPFNFAAHARQLGHKVLFVSAVGKDRRGDRILERMEALGLSTIYVRSNDYPTGVVSVTTDSRGQPDYVIHRPAAYDFPQLSQAEIKELLSPSPDWIYFGTLLQTSGPAFQLTRVLLTAAPGAHRFYDVNLRRGCYTPVLVQELMKQTTVFKLNQQEADGMAKMFGNSFSSLEDFCRSYAGQFRFEAVVVTLGESGCAIFMNDCYAEFPGYPMNVVDTVGAGDAFSAAFVHGFSACWEPAQIADFANRVGALVAGRPGAIPRWTIQEALELGRNRKPGV
ncbi:MAG TPA: carbohydrate kinase [Candidatus Angelobacter sp.]|jgi:fructokinase|nr:carbohydrate kinase [Candidatus Angelobacter sp.]